jgi:hypothetical protein
MKLRQSGFVTHKHYSGILVVRILLKENSLFVYTTSMFDVLVYECTNVIKSLEVYKIPSHMKYVYTHVHVCFCSCNCAQL